jgi:hypothetical protein
VSSQVLVSSEAETFERANVLYRQARHSDVPMMAEIRAADWGTEEYSRERILQYLTHKLHPLESCQSLALGQAFKEVHSPRSSDPLPSA